MERMTTPFYLNLSRSKPKPRQRGSSFVELAVLLPVAMLTIGGVVDYGLALREMQSLSTAARFGARYAASSHDFGICNSTPCENPEFTEAGDLKTPITAESLSCFARGKTIEYLGFKEHEGKLSPNDWDVTAAVVNAPAVDTISSRVVTVKIARRADRPRCKVCWMRLLSGFVGIAEATMPIVGACE